MGPVVLCGRRLYSFAWQRIEDGDRVGVKNKKRKQTRLGHKNIVARLHSLRRAYFWDSGQRTGMSNILQQLRSPNKKHGSPDYALHSVSDHELRVRVTSDPIDKKADTHGSDRVIHQRR